MAFEGDLSKVPLGDVCQTLVMTRQHGVLVVRGPEQRRIAVGERGISLVGARASLGERVARYLLATGGLDVEGLAAAEKVLRRRRNARLDDVLQSEGLVQADVLRAARAYVAQEEVFEMFFWREGTFALLEGRKEEGGPFAEITFDIAGIAMEAARRIDEMQGLDNTVPLTAVVAQGDPLAAPREEQDGDAACRIFNLIAEVDSVREIVEASHLGEFDTRKTLEYLMQSGALRHAGAEEIAAAAGSALGRDTGRAVALFERLTQLQPESDEAWSQLAEARRKAGDRDAAAQCLRTVARLRISKNDGVGAIEALKKATDLAQENADVHEEYVNALFDHGDAEGGLKATRAGVSRCAELGAHDSVVRMASRALEHDADDAGILIGLAASLQALQRTDEAIRTYESAAVVLERSKRGRDRLADVLRRLIRIASDSKEYEKRLSEIQREKTQSRRKLRNVALAAAAVLVLGAVAIPLSMRDGMNNDMQRIHELIDREDYEAAEQLIAKLSADDPSEEMLLRLKNMRGLLNRGKSGETTTQSIVSAMTLALKANDAETAQLLTRLEMNPVAVAEGVTLAEAMTAVAKAADALANSVILLTTGDGATLRERAPDKHKQFLTEFANDANPSIKQMQSGLRLALVTSQDVAAKARLSPAFKRGRLKVEPSDREALEVLVAEARAVVDARDATNWEGLASVLQSLSQEVGGLDPEPIRVAREDISAFLESAEVVAGVAAEGEAYIAKIDMFLSFREARTRGIELTRKGLLEEALDLQERFLLSCRRARENEDDQTVRAILTEYLDAQPLLEEEIQNARDELHDVLSKERDALAARQSGKHDEAFYLLTALVKAHPTVGFAERFSLPLTVRTSPPGAEIRMGDSSDVIGHSPTTIDYPIEGDTRIVLRVPGYEDAEIIRRGARKDSTGVVDVVLDKKIRWQVDAGAPIQSRAAIDSTYAYIAARDGVVRSYARSDGTRVGGFESDLLGGFSAAPAVFGGRVFVASVEGIGFVFESGTLKEAGRFRVGNGVRLDLVAIPHGVLVADQSGTLTLIDEKGGTVWSKHTGVLAGEPQYSTLGVVVLSTAGEIAILNPQNGSAQRRIPLAGAPVCEAPVVYGTTLYAATHGRALVAVDLAGGREIWRRDVQNQLLGRAAVTADAIAWIGGSGDIHVFDRANGAPRSVLPVDGGAAGRLGSIDGDILCVTKTGVVRRLRDDGTLVWLLDCKAPVVSDPAAAHGGVVVTGKSGLVLEVAR